MMADDASLKRRLLGNRFAFRLRDEAVLDEEEFSALRSGLVQLAASWEGRSEVDKEMAGWLASLLPTVAGSVERLQQNAPDHDLTAAAGRALGEMYDLIDSCFATRDIQQR